MKLLALLVLVPALVAVPGASGAGATRTIGTRGAVVSISADGGTVVIHAAVAGDPDCDSGSAWTPSTGKVVRFQDARCGPKQSDKQYDALTLAGSRAVWTDYDYGNHAYCTGPYIATLAKPRPADLGECPAEPDNEDMYWQYAGDGTLLVARSYVLCEASCPPDYDKTFDDQVTFWRVGAGLTKLLTAKDDTKLLDVDAGRILVLDPSKKLLVLDASGKQVGSFTPVDDGGAFMSGASRVLVGTRVYDVATGKTVKTVTLKGDAKLMDVENGEAVYFSGTEVRLLTLASGRDRLVARQRGLGQAYLEPNGLFYSYNVPGGGSKPGRVSFIPASALPK